MTNFVEHRVQAAGFSSTTVRDEKFNCEIGISIRREYALWGKQVGQRIMVASVADRSRSVSTGVAASRQTFITDGFLILSDFSPAANYLPHLPERQSKETRAEQYWRRTMPSASYEYTEFSAVATGLHRTWNSLLTLFLLKRLRQPQRKLQVR